MVEMNGTGDETWEGILRFGVPDHSVGPEDRCMFAFPANREVKEEKIQLHDARRSSAIVHGPEGLDVQGFAYINYRSVLADSESWFTGQNIEDVYFPEVKDLICSVTGAKSAAILDCAFRRRLADKQADPNFYLSRGCELDQEIAKLPRDVALVYGKDAGGSLEPARIAHIDYTINGLRNTARYRRDDIVALGQKTLDAEDAVARGEKVKVPRMASFSVWRPLRTVLRDPLAVCDYRTLDLSELESSSYRALSNVTENGEYLLQADIVLPPKEPSKQKWYWIPRQQPDEALIIKFADTAADEDPKIARGAAHLSPTIAGTEDEEPRCSIECRVMAFWD